LLVDVGYRLLDDSPLRDAVKPRSWDPD